MSVQGPAGSSAHHPRDERGSGGYPQSSSCDAQASKPDVDGGASGQELCHKQPAIGRLSRHQRAAVEQGGRRVARR